jgi:hypothetical protein
MSGWCDPHFQLLEIETCTPKLIVKKPIYPDRNSELTSLMFVGHVTVSLDNSQPTIFRISVGNRDRNPSTELIEIL